MITNGKIESYFLGKEDHGIPTFNLYIKYEGSHQSFGGYDLRYKDNFMFIFDLLSVFGISSIEELKGTYCRIETLDGIIVSIGHIVEDKWFKYKNGVTE